MELFQRKVYESKNCTISRLFINGKPECYILQDGHRAVKEYGMTRIPEGRYKVRLKNDGGFTKRYAKKFGPEFHKGMLELVDVPKFKGILFHIGNTPEDTAGCLLPGRIMIPEKNFVAGSEEAYREVYPLVRDQLLSGLEVRWTISYA